MRSRRKSIQRRNTCINRTGRRHETVYVASPCEDSCNDENNISCPPPDNHKSQPNKTHGVGINSILSKFLGKSNSDDFLLIILIAIIFLSRRKNEETGTDEKCSDETKEFSVTDFLTKVSGILNKFNDNDILLIALLYILL